MSKMIQIEKNQPYNGHNSVLTHILTPHPPTGPPYRLLQITQRTSQTHVHVVGSVGLNSVRMENIIEVDMGIPSLIW